MAEAGIAAPTTGRGLKLAGLALACLTLVGPAVAQPGGDGPPHAASTCLQAAGAADADEVCSSLQIGLVATPNPTAAGGTVSFSWSVSPETDCWDNLGNSAWGGYSFSMTVSNSFTWVVYCTGTGIESNSLDIVCSDCGGGGGGGGGGGSVPAVIGGPTISGTPQVGQTLVADHGSWTNDPTSYDYSWKRSGDLQVLGADQALSLTSAEAGYQVRVDVRACNGTGCSGWTSSAWTSPVGASPTGGLDLWLSATPDPTEASGFVTLSASVTTGASCADNTGRSWSGSTSFGYTVEDFLMWTVTCSLNGATVQDEYAVMNPAGYSVVDGCDPCSLSATSVASLATGATPMASATITCMDARSQSRTASVKVDWVQVKLTGDDSIRARFRVTASFCYRKGRVNEVPTLSCGKDFLKLGPLNTWFENEVVCKLETAKLPNGQVVVYGSGHFAMCLTVRYGCIYHWYPWVRLYLNGDGSWTWRRGT